MDIKEKIKSIKFIITKKGKIEDEVLEELKEVIIADLENKFNISKHEKEILDYIEKKLNEL